MDAKERFLRYVTYYTTSDDSTGTSPSTERQKDLGQLLMKELDELGRSPLSESADRRLQLPRRPRVDSGGEPRADDRCDGRSCAQLRRGALMTDIRIASARL